MGNFRKKPRKENVAIITVAVGCTNNKPEQESPDVERMVTNAAKIREALEQVEKLGKCINASKAAYIEATKRINELLEEINRLQGEKAKAKEAFSIDTKKLLDVTAFLKDNGINI